MTESEIEQMAIYHAIRNIDPDYIRKELKFDFPENCDKELVELIIQIAILTVLEWRTS